MYSAEVLHDDFDCSARTIKAHVFELLHYSDPKHELRIGLWCWPMHTLFSGVPSDAYLLKFQLEFLMVVVVTTLLLNLDHNINRENYFSVSATFLPIETKFFRNTDK